MSGCFGVDHHGYGGGLALLWDASVSLSIQNYSNHHIDAEVTQEDGVCWRITGFYGHSEVAFRLNTWALPHQLHGLSTKPWLVLGDFNEMMALDEKWGREDWPLRQMVTFVMCFCNALFVIWGSKDQSILGQIGGVGRL